MIKSLQRGDLVFNSRLPFKTIGIVLKGATVEHLGLEYSIVWSDGYISIERAIDLECIDLNL